MGETVLVFPAGLPDALSFRAQAAARGCTVIGASSIAYDPAEALYDSFERLPFVHLDGFPADLAALVARRGVEAIYAPHEVVARRLGEVLGEVAPQVRLIEAAPMRDKERAYAELRGRAATLGGEPWLHGAARPAAPALRESEAAGLLRWVEAIPGMCDADKIAATVQAMRHTPPGDVVEIGSWWGRSAALLAFLARRWEVGPVLCVDPWTADALPQGVPVLDRASASMDVDEALRIFEINLAPVADGRVNYLRARSTEGAALYRAGLEVSTEAFGVTRYGGAIAFLHIDGNHALERVQEDARAWTPFVRPGGWIVFDDYVWAFGDGPRQVGDAFLAHERDRIATAFVMGTALFVQLRA